MVEREIAAERLQGPGRRRGGRLGGGGSEGDGEEQEDGKEAHRQGFRRRAFGPSNAMPAQGKPCGAPAAPGTTSSRRRYGPIIPKVLWRAWLHLQRIVARFRDERDVDAAVASRTVDAGLRRRPARSWGRTCAAAKKAGAVKSWPPEPVLTRWKDDRPSAGPQVQGRGREVEAGQARLRPAAACGPVGRLGRRRRGRREA